jgi:AraC-like DNA-binding protein
MANKIEEGIMIDIGYMVYRECTPTWIIDRPRPTPWWDITYVLRGSAEYVINDVKYEVSANDLLCIPRGSIRRAGTCPKDLMRCYAVNFCLKDIQGQDVLLPFPVISHIGEQRDIINLFEELSHAWIDKQPGYKLKTCGLLLLILHRLFEITVHSESSEKIGGGGVQDYRIKKIQRYIMKHYNEKLSVKEMASMIGLNPVYFGALFKRETGLTVNRYITNTRIKNAENLLQSGGYKVAEVAEQCGFSDVFYFDKQFKKVFGFPPSQCILQKGY